MVSKQSEIYLLFSTCIVLFCISGHLCQEEVMIKMKAVKDKIFKDYDSAIRPMNDTNYTRVEIDFIPSQIMSLDEETSVLSVDAYLWMVWWDHRLAWDVKEYEGKLALPSEYVWKPDISIFNSHTRPTDMIKKVLVSIYPSGVVTWGPPLHTQTYCPDLAIASYPNDRVECMIEIGSWAYDGFSVDISHLDSLWLDYFQDINPRWTLIQSDVKALVNDTHKEQFGFIKVDIKLPLKRRPLPEVEASRASCTLIIVLALSIFWIPTDSSKKILLGGFLFLSLTFLVLFVANKTKHPLAVLYAVSYIQSAMYIVVTTILVQVLVITRLASFRGPSRPPSVITNILQGPIGQWACLGSQEDRLSLDRIQLKEDYASNEGGQTARDEWKMLATAIDRVMFVIMAIAAISVHHL